MHKYELRYQVFHIETSTSNEGAIQLTEEQSCSFYEWICDQKTYPATSLSDDELKEISSDDVARVRKIANAAIKKFIDRK